MTEVNKGDSMTDWAIFLVFDIYLYIRRGKEKQIEIRREDGENDGIFEDNFLRKENYVLAG